MIIENKKVRIRSIIQIFFFVLVTVISVNHYLADKGLSLISSASLHSICPFGGVVSIYQYITTSTLAKKIHESSLVLM